MKALITGGAGFIGTMVAERLLAAPSVRLAGEAQELTELVIADLVAPRPHLSADPRVRAVVGGLEETLAAVGEVDLVLHLAGVVSGAAEADLDLGLRTNLDGTRAVLEHARHQAVPPVLLLSSSLAVYGHDPALPPLGVVDDDTMPRPQSSYGVQKLIGEQLVADYGRRGLLRARTVRLMTVAVRPGKPNAAASGFLSGIIREPLAGIEAVCPVPPDTAVALSSPSRTVAGILRAVAADDAEWGSRTAMNLPALTTTPREMARSLDTVTGERLSDLIRWEVDPAIETMVASWPARFTAARAARLGLTPDSSFDDLVREHIASEAAARR